MTNLKSLHPPWPPSSLYNSVCPYPDIHEGNRMLPVCFRQYWYELGTGILWTVPVCSGHYRYALDSTITAQSITVLYRAYWSPKHTSTAQSIPLLPKCFIFQAVCSHSFARGIFYNIKQKRQLLLKPFKILISRSKSSYIP